MPFGLSRQPPSVLSAPLYVVYAAAPEPNAPGTSTIAVASRLAKIVRQAGRRRLSLRFFFKALPPWSASTKSGEARAPTVAAEVRGQLQSFKLLSKSFNGPGALRTVEFPQRLAAHGSPTKWPRSRGDPLDACGGVTATGRGVGYGVTAAVWDTPARANLACVAGPCCSKGHPAGLALTFLNARCG